MGECKQFMHGRPALGAWSEDVEVLLGLRTPMTLDLNFQEKKRSLCMPRGLHLLSQSTGDFRVHHG